MLLANTTGDNCNSSWWITFDYCML